MVEEKKVANVQRKSFKIYRNMHWLKTFCFMINYHKTSHIYDLRSFISQELYFMAIFNVSILKFANLKW